MNRLWMKIIVSILAAVIGFLSATSVIGDFFDDVLFKEMARDTDQYLNQAMVRAGSSYGLLRVGNGIVSIIQETEVGVPATGTAIAFGQGLDPLNDILERTSTVMMISLTSLGIQKILVKIGSWLSLTVLLTAAMGALLAGLWVPGPPRGRETSIFAVKLILLSIIVYFFVPLTYYTNGIIYDLFVKETYETTISEVENFNEDLKQIQSEKEAVEKGFWDAFDIKARVAELKQKFFELYDRMEKLIPRLIDMAVVFILQTVLLPIAFLWLLLKLISLIFRSDRLGNMIYGYTGKLNS